MNFKDKKYYIEKFKERAFLMLHGAGTAAFILLTLVIFS